MYQSRNRSQRPSQWEGLQPPPWSELDFPASTPDMTGFVEFPASPVYSLPNSPPEREQWDSYQSFPSPQEVQSPFPLPDPTAPKQRTYHSYQNRGFEQSGYRDFDPIPFLAKWIPLLYRVYPEERDEFVIACYDELEIILQGIVTRDSMVRNWQLWTNHPRLPKYLPRLLFLADCRYQTLHSQGQLPSRR